MRRVGIAWDKTRRLDGGRALGSMRDSKAACVCACPCLCGVHVLKPNRRQLVLLLGQSAARMENSLSPRTFSLALGGAA